MCRRRPPCLCSLSGWLPDHDTRLLSELSVDVAVCSSADDADTLLVASPALAGFPNVTCGLSAAAGDIMHVSTR